MSQSVTLHIWEKKQLYTMYVVNIVVFKVIQINQTVSTVFSR